MIHQPLGGAQGQAADIEIQANEILHHKLTLNGYLSEFTGQSMERITQVRRLAGMGQSAHVPPADVDYWHQGRWLRACMPSCGSAAVTWAEDGCSCLQHRLACQAIFHEEHSAGKGGGGVLLCDVRGVQKAKPKTCCAQDTDRDFFMGAEEAVEYGLIDAVISRPQLIAATNGAQY